MPMTRPLDHPDATPRGDNGIQKTIAHRHQIEGGERGEKEEGGTEGGSIINGFQRHQNPLIIDPV